MKNNSKHILTALMALTLFALIGCSKEKTPVTEPEASAEVGVTAEVTDTPEVPDEPTVEPSTEPEETPVEEVPIGQWIQSLKTEEIVLFVFNECTGVREILKEEEKYTALEGDVLGLWYPKNWDSIEGRSIVNPISLFSNCKLEYQCMLFYLDDIEITEEIFVDVGLVNTEGDEVYFTFYLTK